MRMARTGHFFGFLQIPTPVFGVDSTPRVSEWVGAWVGWGNFTGGAPGQDPTPNGGGGGGLYKPQNGCTEQWVLWAPEAPEIVF